MPPSMIFVALAAASLCAAMSFHGRRDRRWRNISLALASAYAYLEAIEPRNALALVRAARDPFVLCNRRFERWVIGEQLPTAETSAFNQREE